LKFFTQNLMPAWKRWVLCCCFRSSKIQIPSDQILHNVAYGLPPFQHLRKFSCVALALWCGGEHRKIVTCFRI